MSILSPGNTSRWAVLVGIDHYGGKENLSGCVNDTILVYNFLRNRLGVPASQIFLHIARDVDDLSLEPLEIDQELLEATPAAVKQSLERVKKAGDEAQKSKSDCFLHIHFSGHGNSQNTIFCQNDTSAERRKELLWFPGLILAENSTSTTPYIFKVMEKSPGAKDELLCFPGEQIVTDVEFGKMLMALATSGLTVSVTLDCCFSGGMMRDSRGTAVRCISSGRKTHSGSREIHNDYSTPLSWYFRNCHQRDSFLYRQQQYYNAIMACQADQQAFEGMVEERHPSKIYGAFTHHFIDRLESLAADWEFITYGQFQGILGAILHETLNQRQIPAYFGPENRHLFGCTAALESRELAYVKRVASDGSIVIARGTVMGARLGDVYQLVERPFTDAEGTEKGLQAEITSVEDFESSMCLGKDHISRKLSTLKVKRVAQLTGRAPVPVLVVDDASEIARTATKMVFEACKDKLATSFRLILHEETATECHAELTIRVSGGELEIMDDQEHPFEHLPRISNNDPEMQEKLKSMLIGMHNYLTFFRMRSLTIPVEHRELFQFEQESFKVLPNKAGRVYVASHRFKFTNKSTRPLYFGVLNLNPGYGIEIVYPPTGGGQCIAAGQSIGGGNAHDASMVFDTFVPSAFLEQYDRDRKIRDIRRLIVATQPIDLRSLAQPDVISLGAEPLRHGDVTRNVSCREPELIHVPPAGWWLEDYTFDDQNGTVMANDGWGQRPKINMPPSKFKVGQLVFDKRLPEGHGPYKIADKPRPQHKIYLLCDLHNKPIDNLIDGGTEFKEEHLSKA